MPPLLNTATCYLGSTQVGAIYAGSTPLVSGGIRAAIMAAFPVESSLPNTVVLRKLRADTYTEFAVYSPLDVSGINWARWFFTNRFNLGATGAARMCRATLSKLYASTPQATQAENLTTQVQSIAPTSTKTTAQASSRVGTWQASATLNGVTDTTYSTTIGDYVEYQVTTAGRLQLRTQCNTTNGGVVEITVKDGAGTLIADSRLMQPAASGVMTINLKTAALNGGYHIPIAEGLASDTYTVRITVAATNPAGGRAYDAGFEVYSSISVTSAGQLGTWETRTLVGSVPTAILPGAVRIYAFTGTRVVWQYGNSTNAGRVDLRVYKSDGSEIESGKYQTASRTQDTYFGASQKNSVVVAAGLPAGTYYLRIQTLASKHASSSGYRVYDYGVTAYNEGAAGVVGTDDFDDLGTTDASLASGPVLIGVGNLELAIRARRLDEAPGVATDEFVGGTHGSETMPANVTVKVSGSTIDYAAAAAGAQWIGTSAEISYDTSIKLLVDASVFATANYVLRVDRGGYTTDIGRTYTASVYVTEDYSAMFNVPSRKAGNPGYGGGCNRFLASPDDISGDRTYPLETDNTNNLPQRQLRAIWFNDVAAASCEQLNWPEIDAAFSAPVFASSRPQSFVQERGDGYIKTYNRCFPGGSSGVVMPVGTTARAKARYRIALRP